MRPRKYINRIEIYENTYVDDGYGGQILGEPNLLGKSWCNVKTLRAERITELGLSDNRVVIELNLRYRNDIEYRTRNMCFRYKGIDFNPVRIESVNIENYEIKILAASNGERQIVEPPVQGGFPYTFPLTLS